MTISCVMIVKNEENILARCLDSISDLMDEIVIVDTGSMDATKEIAARYTDKIYDFTWTGNFSDARNFAFSKATIVLPVPAAPFTAAVFCSIMKSRTFFCSSRR